MQGILDQFAGANVRRGFYPQSAREFFALRLAQKLGDVDAVRRYAQLVEQRSQEILAAAFRRMIVMPGHGDIGHTFLETLQRIGNADSWPPDNRLLAIRIQRRSLSVAFFINARLDYTETRHLPASPAKADISVLGFINSTLSHFKVESAAVERVIAPVESQRVRLSRLVGMTLREYAVPVWEVDKYELISAYGHPAPKSRGEVRRIVRTIWPVLPLDGGVLDAVALGLYTQVERLFTSEA